MSNNHAVGGKGNIPRCGTCSLLALTTKSLRCCAVDGSKGSIHLDYANDNVVMSNVAVRDAGLFMRCAARCT